MSTWRLSHDCRSSAKMSGPTVSYHRRKAFRNGDLERYAVRHRLPAPAPAEVPSPQPLVFRVPPGVLPGVLPGVQVEVVQVQPAADLAFAT